MGVTLGRTGYSPNIKERLDFSCALFLADGAMLAQAAHMPVHLGAMPASVHAALNQCAPFAAGDVVILNDPYHGGNHLPDITLVSPVFPTTTAETPLFFVASRAHHADVGGMSPGSMPLSSELFQEGIIIPPIKLITAGQRNEAVWQLILRNVRTPDERAGDLAAQLAAHTTGERRLLHILNRYGTADTLAHAHALIAYAEKLTRAAIEQMPNGRFTAQDHLDNDGHSSQPVPIHLTLTIADHHLTADFTGTAPAVRGNLNAVPAIVESAVAYCLRAVALALTGAELPMNQGAFAPLTTIIEPGSLLNPHPPHAVAAGNVETSQRIVDVVFRALGQALPHLIPAASQGTMNNLTFGNLPGDKHPPFAYYETIGGGIGAGPQGHGGHGLHSHMSNTRNTPIEAMEYAFPLRITEYALRHGSGGRGQHNGGDGLIRQIQFLTPVQITLTTERRISPPYALGPASPGALGHNTLIPPDNAPPQPLPAKTTQLLPANSTLRLETPGGGGWSPPPPTINKSATPSPPPTPTD